MIKESIKFIEGYFKDKAIQYIHNNNLRKVNKEDLKVFNKNEIFVLFEDNAYIINEKERPWRYAIFLGKLNSIYFKKDGVKIRATPLKEVYKKFQDNLNKELQEQYPEVLFRGESLIYSISSSSDFFIENVIAFYVKSC